MVEVRYSIYFLEQVPRSGAVVEVEVYPISFSWRRRGRGVVEVKCSYIPRRKSGIYWIQVRRAAAAAAAAAAVEISLWTR